MSICALNLVFLRHVPRRRMKDYVDSRPNGGEEQGHYLLFVLYCKGQNRRIVMRGRIGAMFVV